MDLTSKKNIKNLLKKYDARPLKRLGQNFLVDKSILRKIIESAELKKEDIVLEIGSGIGTLTQEIAKKVKKVIAIEKDKKMVQILRETLVDFKNVEKIHTDILKLDLKLYTLKPYKIVANLPYYIVSPVIREFLDYNPPTTSSRLRRAPAKNPPKLMILMVQKEVAQRICAKPPKTSLLSVSVQFYAKPEVIDFVPRNSFWPQPKVNSAILRISRICTNLPRINTNLFFKIVKTGFSQPRKQLVNNLSKVLELDKEGVKEWLLKNKIKPSQRAETLTIKDWIKLTRNWYKI